MSLPYKSRANDPTRFGLVVLKTDEVIERELAQILPLDNDHILHVTRIPFATEVTSDTLGQMEHDLPASVKLLPEVPFDVIGYGCTSGATVIGSDNISRLITSSCTAKRACDPIGAVIKAAHHLGIRNLAMVTPYIEAVSQRMRNHLEASGVPVCELASFDILHDPEVARVSPASIRDAMLKIGRGPCDGIFASCTNLAALSVIPDVEEILGKPVLTSNQALAWAMCRAAGVTARPGHGRLFNQ